jgi:putative oxidoreductase
MALGKALSKYRDFGILILRAGLGVMFMYAHGSAKLFGGPERWAAVGASMKHVGITFAPAFWGMLAGTAEFFGGFFLLLGLFVRPAALALTFCMVVASLNMYAASGSLTGSNAHPVEVGIAVLALVFIGAGKYSLDQKLGYN